MQGSSSDLRPVNMSVSGMKKQLHKASQVTRTNRVDPGRAGLNRPDVFCTGGLILSDAATQGLQHRSLITTDLQEH